MASISIHTGILTSPKHVPLSDGALRLWLHGLCWSKEHLTDGFIPQDMVPSLHPKARRFVGELLTVRVPGKGALWEEAEGGYRIHDYADWQETKAEVEQRRHSWRIHTYRREVVLQVRRRDADRCRYCGQRVTFGARGRLGGTLDHVVPGDAPTVESLVTACRSCNSRKGRRTPEQAGMPLLQPQGVI